jgi:ABC-2 type transport system permease protein
VTAAGGAAGPQLLTHARVAPLSRMLLMQSRAELAMRWRVPAFSVTSLILPVLFFTFFGLRFAGLTTADGVSVGALLVASFGAYGVGSVMVFAFGVGVAAERAMKIDVLMRATPLPPVVHVLAKIVTALVFGLGALVVLIAFGIVVGGIQQPITVWLALVVRLLAGSVPFIALGFAIGYLTGPHAAPAVANLVFLPLAFASGLFMPLDQLPEFVRAIAPYLPTYHYGQLGWAAVGAPAEPLHTSVLWLAAYTALFLTIAIRAYRREEHSKFG